MAEHRGVLEQRPVGRVEAVQPRRDERLERLRHGQLAEVADGLVVAVGLAQPPVGHQHPDGLDRVQRDAVGAGDDRARRGQRQAGDEAGQELVHRRLGQRLQPEGQEVAPAGAPVGPALEQVRTGERDDQDRDAAAPFEQVVDEVELARIRPLEVLEQEADGAGRRQPFEERPPRPEELVATAGRGVADAQQREHRRLDPGAFALVRDVRREHLRDLRPGRLRVVRLEEAGARPDHLAERPERDPLAIGRRAAVVPPDAFDDAVDVLEELPRQPALADPGLARDRDEPGALLAGGGVEEVLEQAQLLVATDERRLEPVAPAETLALADDAQGEPGRHRQLLALQDLVGDGLEGDRAGRGSLGGVADEDRAGRAPRSGAARRC